MAAVVNISGVDGYMATWVDFLLMARANALVNSIIYDHQGHHYHCFLTLN